MVLAGLILKNNLDEDCKISFLMEEDLECFSVKTNEEIVELVERFEPEVLAVNVGMDESPEEFTDNEKELVEDGFSFIPNSQKKKIMKRLESLSNHLNSVMGVESPELIRYDPLITAKELAINSDSDLESLGINVNGVKSAEMFDAVLGSVTARFYQQNQFEDFEVIVPTPISD